MYLQTNGDDNAIGHGISKYIVSAHEQAGGALSQAAHCIWESKGTHIIYTPTNNSTAEWDATLLLCTLEVAPRCTETHSGDVDWLFHPGTEVQSPATVGGVAAGTLKHAPNPCMGGHTQ